LSNAKRKRSGRPDSERRLRQASRHARVIRVLQLISGKGAWTARKLATELECAERTVYRDLAILELAGVPWYFNEEQQSYRVREDFWFPTFSLSVDELIGQATAGTIAKAQGLRINQGTEVTLQRLRSGLNEKNQELLKRASEMVAILDLKLADHSRSEKSIDAVQRAILQRRQLEGSYRSPYAASSHIVTLHPLRLCMIKQAWYLIAKDSADEAIKSYRLTRFLSLNVLSRAAENIEEFDIRQHFANAWGVFRGDRRFSIKLRFTSEAAPLVQETQWHHSQACEANTDGSLTVSFEVDGLEEIVWWVLGWSSRVSVIEPKELKKMVREKLQAALKMN
jgi:predicted DNA-binding transcriptional regulator YafY